MATSKLIYIEWVDAVADAGWNDKVRPELHPCTTVGFLISETKEAFCIASTISGDQSNARMHIPKAWIKIKKVFKIEDEQRKSKGTESPAVVS